MDLKKPVFNSNTPEDFYPVLKERVNQYFSSQNISKNANITMVFKTIVILFLFVLSYILLFSGFFNTWGLMTLFALNGFLTAIIGLNITHDAIHGSYSSNPRINKMLSLIFNIVGANDYMWKIMHNTIHHTYTNVPDHDDDINQMKIIRLNPAQERWWIHRFQYIYVFFLYLFATLSWVFVKDYKKFFQPNIGSHNNQPHPNIEYFRLFFYKVVYYTLFIALPMIFIARPWYEILIGFVILHFIEGMTLSLVFQLAHVVEDVSFPSPNTEGKLNKTWAAHQMYTTANFSCNSQLAFILCGGLNFQIEHHLFPKICHIHYKALTPIVRETAKEFNLPYYENKTFIGGIASHIKVLKRFGNN